MNRATSCSGAAVRGFRPGARRAMGRPMRALQAGDIIRDAPEAELIAQAKRRRAA